MTTTSSEPSADAGGSSRLSDVPVVGLAHGSRHARGREAIEALMGAVATAAGVPARAAYLDLAEPDLETVCLELAEAGHTRAVVVPLLFTVAFHATVDVPDAVRGAVASSGLELGVSEVLGTGDDVADVLSGALRDAGVDAATAALLLAVGSSRPEANAAVVDLADRLGGERTGEVRAAFGTCDPRPAAVLGGLGDPVAVWPLFLADGLLLDPLRRLADERGWPFVEPLGARAVPVVLARYATARAAFAVDAAAGALR